MPRQIAGPDLILFLSQLPHSAEIKVVRTAHPTRKMPVAEAIILVNSLAFVAVTNREATKIRHIREVQRDAPKWQPCWRNTEAAVLPMPIDPRIFKRI